MKCHTKTRFEAAVQHILSWRSFLTTGMLFSTTMRPGNDHRILLAKNKKLKQHKTKKTKQIREKTTNNTEQQTKLKQNKTKNCGITNQTNNEPN